MSRKGGGGQQDPSPQVFDEEFSEGDPFPEEVVFGESEVEDALEAPPPFPPSCPHCPFHLLHVPLREQRPRHDVEESVVEGAIEEGEVVGVNTDDEGREVDQVDSGDVDDVEALRATAGMARTKE